jgi:hypothetical protein
MISVVNDYCSDHFPNRDKEIDIDYHCQIEDHGLAQQNVILGDLRNIDFTFNF